MGRFRHGKKEIKRLLSLRLVSQLCTKTDVDFNLSNDDLRKALLLPHSIAFEPYVKASQFKVLNSNLFSNSQLLKLGTGQTTCALFEKGIRNYQTFLLGLPLFEFILEMC